MTTKTTKRRGDMGRIPVGGRLYKFRASWRGAAHENVIKGLSWSWLKKPPPLKEFTQQTSESLDAQMVKLQKKRVIEKARSIKYQSRVFPVPKKDSPEERWVIDLSQLNACIVCPKFRMLTMREVRLLLPRSFWTVALDLKDGYWHILVSRRKRPYLGFEYRGQYWRFRCLPFGLNIAPRMFTKVMAHVIKIMASEGIFVLIYLDDLLIISPTQEKCLEHRDRAIAILEELGWIINMEKSRQQPAQTFDWLGVHLDLVTHSISATQNHMDEFKDQLDFVIKQKFITKRSIMRLQGLAVWIGQSNPMARILVAKTKILLQKLKYKELDTPITLKNKLKISIVKWVYMYNGHPNGCLTQGLGVPNRPVSLPRRIRSINGNLLNKHTGVIDNMVCLAESDQKRSGNTDYVRQLNSSGSCPPQHNNSLSPINNCRTDLEESNQDAMDPHSISHPREIQYCGRPIEQEHNIVHGMVSTSESFQGGNGNEPKSTSRLVRHTSEQSTGDLHLTMSRPESNSSGCHGDTMEQMGPSVPLSPVHYDFEGFTQTAGVTVQECDIDNTRHPNKALVYGTKTKTNPVNGDKSVPTTNGSGQMGNSSHSYKTTRVEVIRQAYNNQFPDCPEAVTLMATPIRKSSLAEYEKKWNRFMTFVEDKNIPFEEITVTTVISFLTQLFHEKHLSPNTVAHYKSALAVPLQVHFNIDLNTTAFKNLLRAMYLQRPNQPVSAPAWSLDKVLTFMEGLTNPVSLEMLLRKTAFLLMLATGWRVSELHACVRNQEYCYFTGDGVLHIRPHPSFLAKNECSQRRWDFKEIKPLRLGDGSISKLCPATTTQEYLLRTQKVRSGNLFLTPNNNSKMLTVHKLSYHICQIIRLADPVAKIKVHEVRKYASSCSFVNTMLVGDLTSAMNWSSPATFFKFYFTQIEPLSTPVTLPVSNQ